MECKVYVLDGIDFVIERCVPALELLDSIAVGVTGRPGQPITDRYNEENTKLEHPERHRVAREWWGTGTPPSK